MASASVLNRLERIGQGVLQPAAGLAALASVLQTVGLQQAPAVQTTVNPFQWDR
jgi:hypothetical protein